MPEDSKRFIESCKLFDAFMYMVGRCIWDRMHALLSHCVTSALRHIRVQSADITSTFRTICSDSCEKGGTREILLVVSCTAF